MEDDKKQRLNDSPWRYVKTGDVRCTGRCAERREILKAEKEQDGETEREREKSTEEQNLKKSRNLNNSEGTRGTMTNRDGTFLTSDKGGSERNAKRGER